MSQPHAFQHYYPEDSSHCYGCGRLNPKGYHIQSFWDGDKAVCRFKPEPYHTAIPGYVYGGLIAALIDCHSTGTAAASAYRQAKREMGSEPSFRFVTASLHVDYLLPTPLGPELSIEATAVEIKERKVVVESTLFALEPQGPITCARGKVVAVRMPDNWIPDSEGSNEGTKETP